MRLPQASSSWRKRLLFGMYVARRLQRSRYQDLADQAQAANQQIKELGRALEDQEVEIQGALASRDAAWDDLKATDQDVRHALASRSVQATREEPYKSIFAEGLDWFKLAPLGEVKVRHDALVGRLKAHLGASDVVLTEKVPALEGRLGEFVLAQEQHAKVLRDQDLASRSLQRAQTAWGELMERIYGELIKREGKQGARSYFPLARTSKAEEPE